MALETFPNKMLSPQDHKELKDQLPIQWLSLINKRGNVGDNCARQNEEMKGGVVVTEDS